MALFVVWIVDKLISLEELLIFVRVIMTWVPVPRNKFTSPIIKFIYQVTEPILGIFRGMIPVVGVGGFGIDLSPLLSILVLEILRNVVDTLLLRILAPL